MTTISLNLMNAPRICSRCGTTVPAGAPENLCFRCLFDTALDAEATSFGTQVQSVFKCTVATLPPIFGDYELLGELGRGGQGIVYRARHRGLGRVVALKTIPPAYLAGAHAWERFLLESSAASRLDHPNLIPIYEVGERDGFCFYTMKLVEGTTLEQLARRGMPDSDACGHLARILVKVAGAVHHAHQRGVLHRDLKPSNILLDQEHEPHVSDFGLARQTSEDSSLTATWALAGTPAYLAPEVATSGVRQASVAADIYGLGAILYYSLTGRPPFSGETLAGTLRAVQETEPTSPRQLNPSASRDLEIICLKCLEKEPAKRYSDANELAEELERFLRDEPILAQPITRIERAWRWCRRKPALASAFVLGVILLLVLGVASPIAAYRINQARRLAQTREQQANSAAAKSQQIAQLLQEMLQGVGPSKAMGRDTTMLREILDKTAERVGKQLTNQPEVELALRNILSRTYDELGLYKQAEEMARENFRLGRAHQREEDVAVAEALQLLGNAQLHLGNYPEAEKSTRAALAMYRKLVGNEHPAVAASLDNLAQVLCAQSKLAEAEAMAREGLELRRKLLGTEHLEVAVSLANLAFVLQQQGRLVEAETMSREAITLLRKVSGDETPELATFLNNLGLILSYQGKPAEAEAIHREALAMRRRLLGNEHPDVAQSLHNLATELRTQGKLTEAEAAVREALAVSQKSLGNEHPNVAFSLNMLATVLKEEGNLADAEAINREALQIRRKISGNDDPEVATSLLNLGTVLDAQGKVADAEAVCREALATYRKTLGNEHPDTAKTLSYVSYLLRRQGKLAEAEEACREALAIQRRLLGEDHPNTAMTLNGLALILQKEGKLADAETLLNEQLLRLRSRPSVNDRELSALLVRLASTLIAEEKFTEAEQMARECLTIREKQSPDDWTTFSTRSILGETLLGQKNYAEAEPLLLSGYEGLKQREAKIHSAGSQGLQEAIQRLVQLYEATNRPKQVADWKSKLEEFENSLK